MSTQAFLAYKDGVSRRTAKGERDAMSSEDDKTPANCATTPIESAPVESTRYGSRSGSSLSQVQVDTGKLSRRGMRKALIVIGDTGSCVPGPLVSDTVDLLKRLRVPVLYTNGVRVGDLCAALAAHCAWIITGNKAMFQLITHRCGVILPKKGGELDVVTMTSIKD